MNAKTADFARVMWGELSSAVRASLLAWLEELPPQERDRPLAIVGSKVVTPASILTDVLNGTDEGSKIIRDWSALALKSAIQLIAQGGESERYGGDLVDCRVGVRNQLVAGMRDETSADYRTQGAPLVQFEEDLR